MARDNVTPARTAGVTMKGMLAVLTIIAVGTRALEAQQAPALGPGRLVRVTAPDLSDAPATLVAATPDTIVVVRVTNRNEAGNWRLDTTRIAVPRGHITGFEVQGSRSHVVEGALIGAAGFALPTFLLGKLFECRSPEQWFCAGPGEAGKAALSAGAVGLAIGALVGIIWRSDEWQPVPLQDLSNVKVGLVPQRGGRLGLGLAVAF